MILFIILWIVDLANLSSLCDGDICEISESFSKGEISEMQDNLAKDFFNGSVKNLIYDVFAYLYVTHCHTAT